jgi:hypothetical protein
MIRKPKSEATGPATFHACTAPPELCIDPFCDHTTGRSIVLDVVAWPDVDASSIRATDPSDQVRMEVANLDYRAEMAALREEARAEKRHNEQVSRGLAMERAHNELLGHAYDLDRQLSAAVEEQTDLEWRLRNHEAWVHELAGMAGDARRAADKALTRWHKAIGR